MSSLSLPGRKDPASPRLFLGSQTPTRVFEGSSMDCPCADAEVVARTERACSALGSTVPPAARPPAFWPRRIATLIKWAVPFISLALVPKCPACVAAYVLCFNGIGVSLPTAGALQWFLMAISVAAVACLILRAAHGAIVPVASGESCPPGPANSQGTSGRGRCRGSHWRHLPGSSRPGG